MELLSYDQALQVRLKPEFSSASPSYAVGLACAITQKKRLSHIKPVSSKTCKHLWESGHHAVFEQVTLCFIITGMSRACLGQITRQRTAHPMSGSQHYQNYSDYEMVCHPTLVNNPVFKSACASSVSAYKELLAQGVSRPEARMALPMSMTTNFMFTIDARNLAYFIEMRKTKRNVYEMQLLASRIHKKATSYFPELFKHICPRPITEWEKRLDNTTEDKTNA